MSSNNFISGMQTVLTDIFYKYVEQKLNPVYSELNSNPDKIFSFVEYLSNFNNFNNNQNIIKNDNIKNTKENTITKNIHIEDTANKMHIESEPTKLSELLKIVEENNEIVKEDEEYNIYSNLNTVDRHFNNICTKVTFNDSELKTTKTCWDLRTHPFDLLSKEEQKVNLIWSFEKFNKIDNVIPYNLDFDHKTMIENFNCIPENWNSITDDININNMKFKKNKIKISNVFDEKDLINIDSNKLNKWKKETLINIENNNKIDVKDNDEKKLETKKENDNFGMNLSQISNNNIGIINPQIHQNLYTEIIEERNKLFENISDSDSDSDSDTNSDSEIENNSESDYEKNNYIDNDAEIISECDADIDTNDTSKSDHQLLLEKQIKERGKEDFFLKNKYITCDSKLYDMIKEREQPINNNKNEFDEKNINETNIINDTLINLINNLDTDIQKDNSEDIADYINTDNDYSSETTTTNDNDTEELANSDEDDEKLNANEWLKVLDEELINSPKKSKINIV
jgi:hypothetical protein